MVFKVEGSLRYRTISGFGPFKKEHVETVSFATQIAPGEGICQVSEDLTMECVAVPQGFVLQGKLKETPCFFGEVLHSAPQKSFSFTMLSVRSVELQARVTPIAVETERLGKAIYVA